MAARNATAADVLLAAPELVDVVGYAAAIAFYLPLALRRVGIGAFGDDASEAQSLLVAHWILTSPTNTTGGGVLASVADGPSSMSFSVPPVLDDFDATSYGSVYKVLRAAAKVGRGLVGNSQAPR